MSWRIPKHQPADLFSGASQVFQRQVCQTSASQLISLVATILGAEWEGKGKAWVCHVVSHHHPVPVVSEAGTSLGKLLQGINFAFFVTMGEEQLAGCALTGTSSLIIPYIGKFFHNKKSCF